MKEIYTAKDVQAIMGQTSISSAYDLIKKLQKLLHRKNPEYKVGFTATIPKDFFDNVILGKKKEN